MFNKSKDARTLYYVIASFIVVAGGLRIVRHRFDRELFDEDTRLLWGTFQNVQYVPLLYVMVLLTTLIPFVIAKQRQNCDGWAIRRLCDFLFFVFVAAMHLVALVIHQPFELSRAMRFAYMCTFIITYQKILMMYKTCANDTRKLTFSHFALFMALPIIVFKWEYPRTKSRNWSRIAMLSVEFVVVLIVIAFVTTKFWMTQMADWGLRPLSITWMCEALTYAYVTSAVLTFGLNYAVLQCWQGIWAELTQFADRRYLSSARAQLLSNRNVITVIAATGGTSRLRIRCYASGTFGRNKDWRC